MKIQGSKRIVSDEACKELVRHFNRYRLRSIEAIISLPQNLFYGASIPACILIMRPNLTGQSPNPNKPEGRHGRMLFINADAEYLAGRAQNYLRAENIEKIASTFERYGEVEANNTLFEALGFSPDVLFAHIPHDEHYRDFSRALPSGQPSPG